MREERHHTTGGSVDASSYPVATRADGYANLSLGYEYEEGFEYECCAGREEGYYHVVDDEEMEEGAECDADELAKLGLDCCSMLDDDGHDAEEVEVVASGPLLRLLAREQSNASAVTNDEEEGKEEEGEGAASFGGGKGAASSVRHDDCDGDGDGDKDKDKDDDDDDDHGYWLWWGGAMGIKTWVIIPSCISIVPM